jgi:hypothetical protein
MIRVYLSGGPGRSRSWGIGGKKSEIEDMLLDMNSHIEFVRSGQSDWIVIPDGVDTASETALKTGGMVVHLSEFVKMMKKKTKKKNTASRTKTTFCATKKSRQKTSRKGNTTNSKKKSTRKS